MLAVDTPAKPCGRCGRGNHDQKGCKFKSATCHKCGKIGHIALVCRSKQSGKHPKGQAKKTKWVSSTEPDQTSVKKNLCGPEQVFPSLQGRAAGQWATPHHGGGYWSSCLPYSRVSCSLTSHPLQAATYWRHLQDLHWRAERHNDCAS